MIKFFCDKCEKELTEENLHRTNIIVSDKDGNILTTLDYMYCNSCQNRFYNLLSNFNK